MAEQKQLQLIGERYVFSGMRADIKEKWPSCIACQQSKITKHPSNPIRNLLEDSKLGTSIYEDHYQIATAVVICLHALIAISVGWKQ